MAKRHSRNKYDVVFALFSLVLGMLMGWLAYDLGGSGVVGAIIANSGLWIFVSALLAYYSQSGLGAALNAFLYFAGVVLAYYTHFALAGGDIALGTFIRPLIFAAIGALLGFITWHAGAKEWLGAICAAVPVSLLIAEGYPIYHSRSMSLAPLMRPFFSRMVNKSSNACVGWLCAPSPALTIPHLTRDARKFGAPAAE